jgi:hypothetical protein
LCAWAHAFSAAAGDRFDHHRIADLLGDLQRFLLGLDDAVAARGDRHARFPGGGACGVLVAHRPNRTRCRSNELNVTAPADLGEMRVLREEAVAGWMASTSPISAAEMMRSIFR